MRIKHLFFFLLLSVCASLFGITKVMARQKPLVWDMAYLKQMKQEVPGNSEAKAIIKNADKYCTTSPVVITDKTILFEPSVHDYCSMGEYWWPDPTQKGKFIRKDGEVNPDSKKYDKVKLSELSKRCRALSQAYYLTGEKKYYDAFVVQLRSWFLDEHTYMAPHFEYAQVIPGQNNNMGRSTGLIDSYYFNAVIESIRLVNYSKRIDRKTMKGMKKWFLDFADWSEGKYGEVMRAGIQNISIAYDVTMINMYLFAGKTKKAKAIADVFAERRLYVQIQEDGSQPSELIRTNAFSYSINNITHIIDFCYLVRYWDKRFYFKNSERIDSAFAFLQQYASKPDMFPYSQMSSWDKCRESLETQFLRVERLRSL